MLRLPKLRRLAWPLAIACVALLAAWGTLRSPRALSTVLRWSLSSTMGTTVEVNDAEWDGWGRLRIGSIRVLADGWPERTAEIASIEGLDSRFRPLDLLRARITLDDLDVRRANLRIARRTSDDAVNLSAIHPPTGRSWISLSVRPERARLRLLQVENLEVRPDGIATLASPYFRGDVALDPRRGPHELRFEFAEIEPPDPAHPDDTRPAANGLRLDGFWNDRTFAYEVNASELDFDRTVRPLLPPAVEEYCRKRLALKGMVSGVVLKGSTERPLAEARLQVHDIAMNLDELGLGLGIGWERFSEGSRSALRDIPRMNVQQGTIVLSGDRLSLEGFQGQLFSVGDPTEPASKVAGSVPLPVSLSLALDFSKLPPLVDMSDLASAEAWLEAAARHCGVDARLSVPEYALVRSEPGVPWAVELPEPIVNVLDNFKVQQGLLTIEARASRPATDPGTESRIPEVRGSLRIAKGRGEYVNFRYPMQNVTADIRFHDERIEVVSLKATGRTGNRMAIKGLVDGAGDDAGVDLNVSTQDLAPIDLDLQNAFDEGPRRIFELLFARDMRDRLVRAGLLADAGSELGGLCAFDIQVKRERGGGSRVETTGIISVQGARVLCSRFPYPIEVVQGEIVLEDEAIVLPKEKWSFRTPRDGTGRIWGRVAIPRSPNGRLARPDLDLVVVNDRVNDLLLAAIPLEDWEDGRSRNERWPGLEWSTAAQGMRALGLAGEVNLEGHIGCDAEGDTTLAIDIRLEDGTFKPRNGEDRLLERSGLPWPEGFDLEKVSAKVHLTEREATLERLSGSAGAGTVLASGSASLRERDRTLRATLSGATIGDWMILLLPEDVQESAAAAWERCEVSGTFDGDIDIHQGAQGIDRRQASFRTGGVRFRARGVPSELRIREGVLGIDGPTFTLTGLQVDALCRGVRAGALTLDGAIALDAKGRQDLRGRWTIDTFASVLWPELLRAANLERIAELHDAWNPVGFAAGGLRVQRTPDGQPDWDIEVTEDGVLVGDPGGVPISLSLAPGGHLTFGPDAVGLRGPTASEPGLVGCLPGGDFALEGTLATGPRGPADGGAMDLRFDIGPIDASLLGVLPDDLASALQAIELRAGAASSDGLRLLGWTPQAPETGLLGGIELQDGSLRAGTMLSRIHARFGIDARGGRPYPVQIDLGGGHGTFMAGDRFFDRAGGALRLDEGADRIEIIDLQADLYSGRAYASATIGGPARDWSLDVRVDGASLPALIRGGATTTAFAASGLVRGALRLGGDLDRDGSLRGVGHLEATQARMAELPLTLRVLQASQLMLPLSDSLERANLDFHVRGDALRFERFDLSCPMLRLMGTGSMNLSTWDISLRFRNRGVVPGLSDLFGAASDALFVIDVSGPAGDPKVQLTPLPPLGQDPSSPQAPPRVAAATRNEP